MYPGGGVEISGSVKAYFALKLTGHDPGGRIHAARPGRRSWLTAGPTPSTASRAFTWPCSARFPTSNARPCRPSCCCCPTWFPVNLYAISSWSRTIIVPLSIMSAYRPVRSNWSRGWASASCSCSRPSIGRRCAVPGLKGGTGLLSWDRFFRTRRRGLRSGASGIGCCRCGERALACAERWMIDRFDGSDGLGAIFPPMVWSIVALKCLGYADDSPEMQVLPRAAAKA